MTKGLERQPRATEDRGTETATEEPKIGGTEELDTLSNQQESLNGAPARPQPEWDRWVSSVPGGGRGLVGFGIEVGEDFPKRPFDPLHRYPDGVR